MSRNGIASICAVGFGVLLAVGGQAVFSQVSTSQPGSISRVQYLCLDQRSNQWSMHAPGLNFEGDHGEFARKLGLKLGDPMQEGTYNKLTSDAINKLAADGWELTTTHSTALQYSFHATYIFKRGR